jgi:hypothetical protein
MPFFFYVFFGFPKTCFKGGHYFKFYENENGFPRRGFSIEKIDFE